MSKQKKVEPFKIPVKGSLGILALGDIGVRAWREVRKANNLKSSNEKK
tara:strand:+ start:67 stop:210 length:144 start_codon:yes stop_codon:yes gene_type:complete